MTEFFFNYREPGLYRPDPEGEEQPNLAAAVESAVLGAREIMAGRIRFDGIWVEGCSFEISDSSGTVLAVLPFEDALVRKTA